MINDYPDPCNSDGMPKLIDSMFSMSLMLNAKMRYGIICCTFGIGITESFGCSGNSA